MNLAFVPLYIKFLGIEAYGLIGFFASLQTVLFLLDMGLGTTFSREVAKLTAVPNSEQTIRNLVKTFSIVYWIIAILAGLAFFVSAPFLAVHWLKSASVAPGVLNNAILLMGLGIAARWPSNVYSGGLGGMQKQVVCNIINISLATLRGGGAVLILWLLSPSIVAFFAWQLVISLLQTSAFWFTLNRHLPHTAEPPRFDLVQLKTLWGFAASMLGISLLSLALTQTDKIVLSKLLPLDQFGYYTLAGTGASVVYAILSPVLGAVFPRFTQLVAENNQTVLRNLYHQSCQLVSLFIIPFGVEVAFFSKEIIFLWTRNQKVAEGAHLVLTILVIGSVLNGFMNVPYQMQLAYKWTSLTIRLNIAAVILLVPLIILLANRYGAPGGAAVWVILNSAYVLIGIPLMHRRLLKSEMWRWFVDDVFKGVAVALLVLLPFRLLYNCGSYLTSLLTLGLIYLLATIAVMLVLRGIRYKAIGYLKLLGRWVESKVDTYMGFLR